MIDAEWKKQRLDAHARFIEAARRQVTEAEERLRLLRNEHQDDPNYAALIETAERLLYTGQGILREMEEHSEYMRDQFEYLKSVEGPS